MSLSFTSTEPSLVLSCNELIWLNDRLRFVVIASTRDMARRVFNSPAYVKPCVVDVAHKLLGSDNWVFLDGKAHIDYRKGLNGLFTRKALQSYLPGQEEVYNSYFKRFLEVTKVRIMSRTHLFPGCSGEISQRVLVAEPVTS